MSETFKDGDRPAEQSHTEHEQTSDSPNIYALSGDTDCDHPPRKWTCLGLQGINRLYQCEQCDGVIIVARSLPQG
jgi:hypothetical protein